MMKIELFYLVLLSVCQHSQQDCPEEVSTKGISVKWYESSPAFNIESDPVCYHTDDKVTRNCTDTEWAPALEDIKPCLKVVKYVNLTTCPPWFHRISDKTDKYCYQVNEPSTWDYPCLESGGGSVLTDFTEEEFESLVKSLIATNSSRYFWLPAQRQKLFNPVVWAIPGPMWGRPVTTTDIRMQTSLIKNCLLLDVEERTLKTDYCNSVYPSLCFYVNELYYPATCPNGYHAFRYNPDIGTCFGIESSDPELTFEEFVAEKCRNPIEDSDFADQTRFIFKKIAALNNLQNDSWCWFKASQFNQSLSNVEITDDNHTLYDPMVERIFLEGIINNVGTMGLSNRMKTLSCMACKTEVIYGETEMMLDYKEDDNVMHLTVYFPSGLWRYNRDDKGIQCFTDAMGFVRVIDIIDTPYFEVKSINTETSHIEKIVYTINLIADTSAQYWCEGHSINFSLITTDKIIVNPVGNEVHVFALVFKFYMYSDEIQNIPNSLADLKNNVSDIFEASQVLLMDILEYNLGHIHVLVHLHIPLEELYEDKASNILETYKTLEEIALTKFPEYNYTFINISSSTFCLPNTSHDIFTLDWDLTPIGHISAPKQFCLQANGLPVKRHCLGSYLRGSVWGEVEGQCDNNYEASSTTKFLYNFVNKPELNNYTTRFLVDGLRYVLTNVDIIIPADIYYLSMSLQRILNIAQYNDSFVDMGDIEHISWVMDRVMIFNNQYLHLAQTLNSTNVILDSINNIVEKLAQKNSDEVNRQIQYDAYQLAVKEQFVVQISFPEFNNITGIAITNEVITDTFSEMSIQPLYMNTTLDQVLEINNLIIASWVPAEIINTLKKCDNDSVEAPFNHDIHIVITVFHNDAVFQEISPNNYTVNSCIIGISIPGFISNLKYSVPIIFKGNNFDNHGRTACGYWDFQKQKSSNVPGSWANQGCFLVKYVNNMSICECYHLTHFGQLLIVSDASHHEEAFAQTHTQALNVITVTGSFLSLIGIVGIWMTAMVFKNWRNKAGTKVLLHLSTAIALPLIFIVVFNLDNTIFTKNQGEYSLVNEMRITCIALGALLHYSILASFMWMLITAILQFIRYVRVLGVRRPSRFMVKCTLVGWGTPLIPVIIVLSIDVETYVPQPSYSKELCYPSGYYLILGAILPICIILLTNIVLFVLVLHAISRGPDGKLKTSDIDLVGTQLRLSIFLFFLLGLTWIFGIFSFSSNLLWSYLFCLTSTLQGFVLFIYFVICDPSTRNLWVTLMKPQFRARISRNTSVTSLSSS